MRPLAPTLLLALLAGCKASDPDPDLRAFGSCGQMERYVRRMAREEAQYRWAWDGLEVGFGAENAMVLDDAGAADTGYAPAEEASSDDTGGAGSYSTTNLQEADVDEDDLVKTDGTWIYALSGDYLTISKAYPTDEAGFASKIEIDGAPEGIYLVDDYVIAVSRLGSGSSKPSPRSGAPLQRSESAYTLATVVDVSDREAPEVVRETYASGDFEASRRIGDTLYLVTYEDLALADDASSLSEARQLIRDASVDDLLPWRMDNVLRGGSWSVARGEACGCTDVYASDQETGTWMTNVLSLDLSDPLSEFQGEAVVGRADTVYASSKAIYVGYSEWTGDEGFFVSTDDQLDSVIHKFDISGGLAHPEYVATAKIPGQMYSQFALSENDSVLRVATTEVDQGWESSAAVRTLSMTQGDATVLGSLTDLAQGESIFAVRFVGDIAYIVTYQQNWGDPLFTIDLHDPTAPRLAGELEVTGFSNYLHPMDDDHLLSVGQDEGDGGEWYLAVSLFDVSDLDSPALSSRVLLDAWSSEAQSDHHAFNYFADAELLAIPSMTTESESVLELLHATPEGLSSIGHVSQAGVVESSGQDAWCVPVRRSVVMDDDVWAVSEAGLTAAAIADPSTTKAEIPFAGTDPCADDYSYEGGDW